MLTPARRQDALPSVARPQRGARRLQLYSGLYVERLSDTKTELGQGRVLACLGWAGAMADFFNILLGFGSGPVPFQR